MCPMAVRGARSPTRPRSGGGARRRAAGVLGRAADPRAATAPPPGPPYGRLYQTAAPRIAAVGHRWSDGRLPGLREDADVTEADATRLAVLIDSDNTTANLTSELLEEIAKYGTPTISARTATGPHPTWPA